MYQIVPNSIGSIDDLIYSSDIHKPAAYTCTQYWVMCLKNGWLQPIRLKKAWNLSCFWQDEYGKSDVDRLRNWLWKQSGEAGCNWYSKDRGSDDKKQDCKLEFVIWNSELKKLVHARVCTCTLYGRKRTHSTVYRVYKFYYCNAICISAFGESSLDQIWRCFRTRLQIGIGTLMETCHNLALTQRNVEG